MANDATIKVSLDINEARARQRELETGFERSRESAAGVGKSLFGGLSPLMALLTSPLTAIGGASVAKGFGGGAAASGFGDVFATEMGRMFGTTGYVNRLQAAQGARDQTTAAFGPAGAFASDESLRAVYQNFLLLADASAKVKTRMDQIAEQDIAQRSLSGKVTNALQDFVDVLPDALFR